MIVIDGNPLANIDAMAHVEIVVKDGGGWYAENVASGPVIEIGLAFLKYPMKIFRTQRFLCNPFKQNQ